MAVLDTAIYALLSNSRRRNESQPGFKEMKFVKFSTVAKNATARKTVLSNAGKLPADAELRNKGESRTPAKRVLLNQAEARAKEAGQPVAVSYR